MEAGQLSSHRRMQSLDRQGSLGQLASVNLVLAGLVCLE